MTTEQKIAKLRTQHTPQIRQLTLTPPHASLQNRTAYVVVSTIVVSS